LNINAINHSRERANAKIVWSHKLTSHPEWLNQPPNVFIDTLHAGLCFDIRSTRDIQPNEEIFLDYGREWEGKID